KGDGLAEFRRRAWACRRILGEPRREWLPVRRRRRTPRRGLLRRNRGLRWLAKTPARPECRDRLTAGPRARQPWLCKLCTPGQRTIPLADRSLLLPFRAGLNVL